MQSWNLQSIVYLNFNVVFQFTLRIFRHKAIRLVYWYNVLQVDFQWVGVNILGIMVTDKKYITFISY